MKRLTKILTGWGALVFGFAFLVSVAPGMQVSASANEYVGAETCVGCHTDRGEAFAGTLHGKKLPLVEKITFEKSCETCHGMGGDHANAGGDANDPGFASITNGTAETCLNCHKGGEVKFWGISSHNQANVSCNKCHSVHAGKGPQNLLQSPNETCLTCHKKERMEGLLPSHHPLAEGRMTCSDCHNPHGGASGNLRAETVNELCFKCHADKAGPFVFEHPPVAEDCSNCHVPHGSQNTTLLKRPQVAVCQACHVQPHWDNGTRSAATSLGAQRIIDYGQCTKCHPEIHGSDRRHRFNPR